MSAPITASSFLKSAGKSLQGDLRNVSSWDPQTNKLQNAIRDGMYLVLDLPKFFMYTHSNYGAMRRYIRQARINKGKVNPEDFKDVDTNVLRESMIRYGQWKGPLQKIDFRFFYWMYAFMIGFALYQGLSLQGMLDAKMDKSGMTLEQRRGMFDDDYEEDVRPT